MDSGSTQDNGLAVEKTENRVITLPTEIHACIIDFLDGVYNVKTILSCMLVCRAWLPFSRQRLYSKASFGDRQRWNRFKDVVLRCKSEAIIGCLGRMQQLWITPESLGKEEPQSRIGWNKGQEQPWAHLALIQCAARLNNLTFIYMFRVNLSPSHDLAIRSGRYYHRLTTLRIQDCSFTGLLQLQQFVTSFPALSDLTMQELRFHAKKIPSNLLKGGHPLSRLWVSTNDHDSFIAVLQWLSQAQLVGNLESLDWWPYAVEKAEEAWNTFTEAIKGPSLQELRCRAHHSWHGWHCLF